MSEPISLYTPSHNIFSPELTVIFGFWSTITDKNASISGVGEQGLIGLTVSLSWVFPLSIAKLPGW